MSSSIITVTTQTVKQNGYLVVADNRDAVLIDPGCNPEKYIKEIETHDLNLKAIIATHGHFDHIGAASELKDLYSVDFIIHSKDSAILKTANFYAKLLSSHESITIPEQVKFLEGNRGVLDYNTFKIKWLHSPGHTPGSITNIGA